MTHEQFLESSGAYALGALSDDERLEFDRHLADCPECRAEVHELEAVVARLADAAPRYRAPTEMRARVMAQVEAEAELLNAAGPGADRPERQGRWWRLGGLSVRPALAGMTLAAVFAAAAIGYAVGTDGGPADPRTVTAEVRPGTGTDARASLELDDGAVLRLTGFRPAPEGRDYQIWVQREGEDAPQATPALFDVGGAGGAEVVVPGGAEPDVARVLVTDEPRGGNVDGVPSGTPLVVAATDS